MLMTFLWIYVGLFIVRVLFFIVDFNNAFSRRENNESLTTYEEAILNKPQLIIVSFIVPFFVIIDVAIVIIYFIENLKETIQKQRNDEGNID